MLKKADTVKYTQIWSKQKTKKGLGFDNKPYLPQIARHLKILGTDENLPFLCRLNNQVTLINKPMMKLISRKQAATTTR